MNINSNENQKIRRDFVSREVYNCVTSEVEFILSTAYLDTPVEAPYSYDDIVNVYVNNEDEINELLGEIEYREELIEETEDTEIVDEQRLRILEIEDEIDDLRREEDEPQEIYEWWSVSSYLVKKLEEWGEPVIPDYNLWGRTCTGQAIFLDSVIGYICKEAKLLVED